MSRTVGTMCTGDHDSPGLQKPGLQLCVRGHFDSNLRALEPQSFEGHPVHRTFCGVLCCARAMLQNTEVSC